MSMRVPVLYVLLALVLAGLIHIFAVMALPYLAPKDAWARLVPLGPPNTMIQLPAPTPAHQVLPMEAPDMRYAFCRFDLAKGPVSLKAVIPDDLWLIAFYTPQGDNFYTAAGADMKAGRINLIIAGENQDVPEASPDAPEEADEAVVVKSPVPEGIALIRAPLAGQSYAAQAGDALKATYCGPHAG